MSLFQMVKGITGKKYTEVRTQLRDSFSKYFKLFMHHIGQRTFERRVLKDRPVIQAFRHGLRIKWPLGERFNKS